LTGRRPATASTTAARTASSARPRGPRAGSLTSISPAPASSATRASASSRTLISNADMEGPSFSLGGRLVLAQRPHQPAEAVQHGGDDAGCGRRRGGRGRQVEAVQLDLEDADVAGHPAEGQRAEVGEAEAEQPAPLEPGGVVEVQRGVGGEGVESLVALA